VVHKGSAEYQTLLVHICVHISLVYARMGLCAVVQVQRRTHAGDGLFVSVMPPPREVSLPVLIFCVAFGPLPMQHLTIGSYHIVKSARLVLTLETLHYR